MDDGDDHGNEGGEFGASYIDEDYRDDGILDGYDENRDDTVHYRKKRICFLIF